MYSINIFGNDLKIDGHEISYMGFNLKFGATLILCILVFLLIAYNLFIATFGSFENGINFIEIFTDKFFNFYFTSANNLTTNSSTIGDKSKLNDKDNTFTEKTFDNTIESIVSKNNPQMQSNQQMQSNPQMQSNNQMQSNQQMQSNNQMQSNQEI